MLSFIILVLVGWCILYGVSVIIQWLAIRVGGYVFTLLSWGIGVIIITLAMLTPFMPFYIAYKNYSKSSILWAVACVLWGLFYIIVAFILYMEFG